MRLTGLFWIAPLFSARAIPGSIRTGVIVVFAILLWPAAAGPAAASAEVNASTLLSEMGIGLVLGLGAAIFVGAAESAGDALAVQMGLSGANVVDPMSLTQLPVLGQLLGLFVTALILSCGGHLVMLGALYRSFELLPLGTPIALESGTLAAVALGGRLLGLGLCLAAPVVGAMMVGNVALGILARTVPQLNVLMVAFPLQIALGLVALAAALPAMAAGFSGWPGEYSDLAARLLRALTPAGSGP
jgi:flagellar biosynthetic protein FliR